PSVQLEAGAEYVLFLEGDNKALDHKATRSRKPGLLQAKLSGGFQGALRYGNGSYGDPATRKAISESSLLTVIRTFTRQAARTPDGRIFAARTQVRSAQKPMAITSFSPTTTNAGTIVTGDFLTINGSGFGATPGSVAFPNANDGGLSYIEPNIASDYVSWSNSSITVKVPASAGTGNIVVNGSQMSASPLTIRYAIQSVEDTFYLFPEPMRQMLHLLDMDGQGGYTFQYHTNMTSNAAAMAAFDRAVFNWRCNTGVNFSTNADGVNLPAARDGQNVVLFENPDDPNALAEAIVSWTGQATASCNQQNTVMYVSDIDIRFRPIPVAGYTWEFGAAAPSGTEFDFESVALHEVGHAHGLGHVIAPGTVMHYALSNGATARTLGPNDIAGGLAMMQFSTTPLCFTPPGAGKEMEEVVCTLPVTFLEFSGTRRSAGVNLLHWKTANEYSNKGFHIQRSADGRSFQEIGFVAASATPSGRYDFLDEAAGLSDWYYRLRQRDENGRSSYSSVIQVRAEGPGHKVYMNEPGQLMIQRGQNSGTAATFRLFASDGKLLLERRINGNSTALKLPAVAPGVYHYQIAEGEAVHTGKLYLNFR
ncbi:MAG TPA: matrixin family metalloprotease, partial [Chitinophagaceae bacterium]|nr:matrixin family metalloprotease [Chitinophagaceae bacterium]